MKTIRKTTKKSTYFKGDFELRDRTNINWACPIGFPVVFTAYSKAIRSGNWQSCTGVGNPDYIIKEYFNNDELNMSELWRLCRNLGLITWKHVENNKEFVTKLIESANKEFEKLPTL
jgi:hypothetical protein